MRRKPVKPRNPFRIPEATGKEVAEQSKLETEACLPTPETQEARARLIAQGSLQFPLAETPEHQEWLCREVSRLRRSRIIGLIANDIAKDIFQEMTRRSSIGAGTGPELNSQ